MMLCEKECVLAERIQSHLQKRLEQWGDRPDISTDEWE